MNKITMKNNFIIILLFCVSCKSIDNSNNCVENIEFQVEFFLNVNYIEKNISILQDVKFKKALIFLSEYVHVSFDRVGSYANTYPIGVLEEEKKGWLEWYENNKSNNLRLK